MQKVENKIVCGHRRHSSLSISLLIRNSFFSYVVLQRQKWVGLVCDGCWALLFNFCYFSRQLVQYTLLVRAHTCVISPLSVNWMLWESVELFFSLLGFIVRAAVVLRDVVVVQLNRRLPSESKHQLTLNCVLSLKNFLLQVGDFVWLTLSANLYFSRNSASVHMHNTRSKS